MTAPEKSALRYWPLIAGVLSLAIAFVLLAPPRLWRATQTIGPNFNRLDGSFEVDLPFRLAQGQLVGRDYVFTYGPLYQLVHSPGLGLNARDGAALLRFHGLLETCLVAAALWGMLTMVGTPLKWKAGLIVGWAALSPDLSLGGAKPIAALACATWCGWLLVEGDLARTRTRRALALVSWAALSPLLSLYSFELGIIHLGALLLLSAGIWVTVGGLSTSAAAALRRRTLELTAAAVTGTVATVAILFLIPSFSDYLPEAWRLAQAYGKMFAYPATDGSLAICGLAIVSGVLALSLLAGHLRRTTTAESTLDPRLFAVLGAACLALLWVRYGLSRSDYQAHVRLAVTPMLFLAVALLPGWLMNVRPGLAYPLLGSWLLVWSLSGFASVPAIAGSVAGRLRAAAAVELAPATLKITNPSLAAAAKLAADAPGQQIHVWPYETILNVVTGKTDPSYCVQSYVAATDQLQAAQITRLSAALDLPVLLFTDSYNVDDVPNYSRSSGIFRYLLGQYEMRAGREATCVLLTRSAAPRAWNESQLALSGTMHPQLSPALELPLDPAAEVRASDLLSLRLRVGQTSQFPIGKPGEIYVVFGLEGKQKRVQKIAVPPDGQAHEILISPCSLHEPLFLSVFHPTRAWQAKERIEKFTLVWRPMDRLTRMPEQIELLGASRLRRQGVEFRETTLVEQTDPELWRWCYDEQRAAPEPVATLTRDGR